MRAHEAGWAHADGAFSGPSWLRPPEDVGALVEQLWPRTARKRDDGVLEVGGVALADLVAEHGSAAYVLDEADFRHRARAFRDAFEGWHVCYAGKAFLCGEVVRWLAEDGLHLDVCSPGELELAVRAGFDAALLTLHGNNKPAALLEHAHGLGIGRIVVDSFDEIARIQALAERAPAGRPVRVMLRVTAGVEAHTHEYIATSHEDQKFGFSLAAGDAFEGVRRLLAIDGVEVLGLHSHIGSQIFDTAGFEVAARRVLGLASRIRDELGVELPELDLGGGFGIAYTTQDDPADPADLAAAMRRIVSEECGRSGLAVPQLSIEPGRAIAGPAACTVYTVGTVKHVALDGGASRTYVSVDGGMSDNVRTALYDADYSCTLASRPSEAAPALTRVVGSHCEAGDIVIKDEFLPSDLAPGDLIAVPATGAYCRSLSSNYNHFLRPPVIAVRDGASRVLLRRETYADLFATDTMLAASQPPASPTSAVDARMGDDEHA